MREVSNKREAYTIRAAHCIQEGNKMGKANSKREVNKMRDTNNIWEASNVRAAYNTQQHMYVRRYAGGQQLAKCRVRRRSGPLSVRQQVAIHALYPLSPIDTCIVAIPTAASFLLPSLFYFSAHAAGRGRSKSQVALIRMGIADCLLSNPREKYHKHPQNCGSDIQMQPWVH